MEQTLLMMLIVIVSTVVFRLGAVITHLAYQAYRRTDSPVLGLFAMGFAFVTFGLLAGGSLDYVFGMDFLTGILLQRVLTAIGYGLLIYSLRQTMMIREGEL